MGIVLCFFFNLLNLTMMLISFDWWFLDSISVSFDPLTQDMINPMKICSCSFLFLVLLNQLKIFIVIRHHTLFIQLDIAITALRKRKGCIHNYECVFVLYREDSDTLSIHESLYYKTIFWFNVGRSIWCI